MATKMFAPSGTTGLVQGSPSGTSYNIASDGSISAAVGDVPGLIAAGFTMADRTSNAATGIPTIRLPLLNGKNSDGSVVAAAAASGKFGATMTIGTSEVLLSEVANNNAKSDTVFYELSLPANYVAAQDLTLTVNGNYTIGGGTLSVKTLTATAYKMADAGTHGSNLIATAAATVPAAAGDMAFVITGTTLSPGDRVGIKLVMALTETASSNVTGQINSLRLS